MSPNYRLMAILAHPDDESMGLGGILAKYAAEGVETTLVTATRGEKSRFGAEEDIPGEQELGQIRTLELKNAAAVLGLREINFLDYPDGNLDRADPQAVIYRLAIHLRRVRPQVVVTFDPNGYYGHPDHVAVAQFTTAAIVAAADNHYGLYSPYMAHRVDKLYYLAATAAESQVYEAAFGELVMNVDGVERRIAPWKDWAVTTRVNTSAHWQKVWQAISCHRSQLPGYQALLDLPESYHRQLWGEQTFYRAFSLVNGGRQVEHDLFDGLRSESIAIDVQRTMGINRLVSPLVDSDVSLN